MANKKTNVPKGTRKAPAAPAVPVENVNAEPANVKTPAAPVINPEILSHAKTTGLDANHQVELLGLMSKHFTGPDAVAKYGQAVESKMDRIVAVGIIAAIAEHAVTGDSVFAGIVKKDAYPMLVSVAKDMNITLPEIKLLPEGTNGTVSIPTESVQVTEEVAAQIAEEQKQETAGDKGEIELDPKKVARLDEEALKKALTYIFITSPKREKFTVKDTLTKVVDFMHDYRIEQARMAENSTEAMNKIEDRTMYEWLKDIQQYAEPTVIARGIGIGLVNLTGIEKSPLSAFITLRGSLIDKETNKPVWDDQSIADATRFFIEFICNSEIAKETVAIENLDSKSKDYKDIVAKHESVIARYKSILEYADNINFDICDKIAEGSDDEAVIKLINRIKFQYYPECDKAVPNSKYTGLNGNIHQMAGIILNLFMPSDQYNKNFSETNLVEVKEMSVEEWQKLMDDAKKQAAKEKKEKSKNA